ncbi:MAG: VPLPA-CTERM sorting domain-containing protein [Pseudomonadota bacterium]
MKMRTTVAAAAFASAALFTATSANAFTLRFDGFDNGLGFDLPQGNSTACNSTGSNGTDLCTVDNAAGFTYEKNGLTATAVAFEDAAPGVAGTPAELIQDLIGPNQGLGVISSDEDAANVRFTQDQINFPEGEAIQFTFSSAVVLTDIALNDGLGADCLSNGQAGSAGEGPCGGVRITTDTGLDVTWDDFLNGILLDNGGNVASVAGQVITFYGALAGALSLTDDFGYSIEQFDISVVPVPAALPLLLSGIAGLGFASRRRKAAA